MHRRAARATVERPRHLRPPRLALVGLGGRRVAAARGVEHAQLARWLAWQALARNPQALARIERTDARLAALWDPLSDQPPPALESLRAISAAP